MDGPIGDFLREVNVRLPQLAAFAQDGPITRACVLMADAIAVDGVIRAFGTIHSDAVAREIVGRAGGLILTPKFALRDVVPHGMHQDANQPGGDAHNEAFTPHYAGWLRIEA